MIRLTLENLDGKARVDLLGQDVSANDMEDMDRLNQIYSYGTGSFSAESISAEIEKLRGEHYDFILVPVATNHLQGYQNVPEATQTTLPEEFFVCVYPEGRLQPVSPAAI